MTKTLRTRLILLGTTSVFALALAAAPVQWSSVTPDLAVAQAAAPGGGEGGRSNSGGGGGHDGGAGGSGSTSTDSSNDNASGRNQ